MKTKRPQNASLVAGRETLRLLRKSLVRVRALTSDLIEPHGLTGQQFLAMYWVSEREGITQIDLAAELDSDANTVSAMIVRLDKKQLIERRRHETDGRAVCLFTTPLGKQLVAETQPDVDRLSLHLLSLIPPEHKEAIMTWLDAIARLRSVP